MDKVKFYLEKYKFVIISFLIVIVLVIMFLFLLNKKETENIIIKKLETSTELKIDSKEKEEKKVKVDIKGRVKKEGVYELEIGSRVIDVIEKAGGLKENANTEYINLSKKLVDEMVIIIYSNDDVKKFKEEDKQVIYIEYECVCPDNINDTCITENDTINTNGVKEENNTKEEVKDTKISINLATKEELMTLPGVGESKAENIIKYREENGEFEKIEDITKVSGIGESVYSKIKDYIKL